MLINNEEHNDICVGIDLGTTNSVLATITVKPSGAAVSKVVELSRAVDVYNILGKKSALSSQKKPLLPSCVYYRQENNYEPVVGDFAKMQYFLRPHLVAKSIKSQMGKEFAEGLSEDIPDKSPAQISARILKHMLTQAEKIYRCRIDDAIITVPANFDPIMCKATRDAAELAGIKVYNKDGSERPVLLSEPNAVIYDLINQVHNGEVSEQILDLSAPRNVLVFDLGGGTLDITMHTISRREDCPDVLRVDDIATNRYTLLGGDDFDEALAEAMYKRYLKQYEGHTTIQSQLQQKKTVIMAQLRSYAEALKLDVSSRCSSDFDDGWFDEEENYPTGGNMGGIGFAYDDVFTKEEVEEILEPFMARKLTMADADNLADIKETQNIIYPILDVLNKAKAKLNNDVQVDAVIVNGGMSKFYMVTDRLKEFFGLEPICALDPDQAVARGAAVYHYYLHKFAELQDNMRLIGDKAEENTASEESMTLYKPAKGQEGLSAASLKVLQGVQAVEWSSPVLNETLYLGLRDGHNDPIIKAGENLPYASQTMTGYRLTDNQSVVDIPIRCMNADGSFRTIAVGRMTFKNSYPTGAAVEFRVDMSASKIITMRAWTLQEDGSAAEEVVAELSVSENKMIGSSNIVLTNNKYINATKGNVSYDVYTELRKLRGRCVDEATLGINGYLTEKPKKHVNRLFRASNPEDFAEPILAELESSRNRTEFRMRLFQLGRYMCKYWTAEERHALTKACFKQLQNILCGIEGSGPTTVTNMMAMSCLTACATKDEIMQLSVLENSAKYSYHLLTVCAITGNEADWAASRFLQKLTAENYFYNDRLNHFARCMGQALNVANDKKLMPVADRIVSEISKVLLSGSMRPLSMLGCVTALGWLCDRRGGKNIVSEAMYNQGCALVKEVKDWYLKKRLTVGLRTLNTVEKLLSGANLTQEEEDLLLVKIED